MASDGAEDEEVIRWQNLVELGPERGLRQAGLSQVSIDKVLSFVNTSHDKLDWEDAEETLSDVEDGMAMLLAFYGRGSEGQYSLQILDRGYVGMNSNEATALCVNMASNTNITSLRIVNIMVFSIDQKLMTHFANALRTNSTLTSLGFIYVHMGGEAVRILLDGLRANKNLSELSLRGNPLLDEGVKLVVEFLCSNTCLKSLNLTKTGYGFEGAQLLAYAFEHNTTLKELEVGNDDIGRDGMKKFLEPLSCDTKISSDGPKNTTLESLHINMGHESFFFAYKISLYDQNETRESFGVNSVVRMIEFNKTLTDLGIHGAPLDAEDWTGKVFPALQGNKTLKRLVMLNCTGLDSEEVRSALMSLIKEGKIRLEVITLGSGNATWDAQVQEELRINNAYRDKLRGQTMVAPTSRRIILCGREFAGKTTIRNTTERTVQGTRWYHTFYMAYKGAMRTFPHLRQTFFGTDAPKELAERTRGFDILVFKDEPRTSLWDFAGQKEYYALHDYMFPNANNSYFLYVCSCRCPPTDSNLYGEIATEKKMRDDFCYWLRFIASNSKPSSKFNQVRDRDNVELPHVKFVLTKIDSLAPGIERANSKDIAERVVAELREQFKSVIEIAENVAFVDAHNDAHVKHLILESVCPALEKIVENQRVYAICEDVQSALDSWSKTDSAKPVVSLEEFHKICQEQKQLTLDVEVQKGILAYLNDMGDVIYPTGLDFIVVKPRWFGTSILGYLVDAFEGASDSGQRRCWTSDCIFGHPKGPLPPRPPENGIITRKFIGDVLDCSLETMNVQGPLGISSERLVQLMIVLEMCFEENGQDPTNRNSRLFLPALFDDKEDKAGRGERKLEWSPQGGKVYLGRRLHVKDESTTFLTPGFFPRLQVHLLLYMQKQHWTKNQGFAMGRNLIRLTENGHDICIEYSGNVGYFIDVMVRSVKPYAEALQFVEEHVIRKIHIFCASLQGCPGVELVEAVVRPACVKQLKVCAERKAVLVSWLREKETKSPGYLHTWEQSEEKNTRNVILRDFALHLLDGEPSPECSSSAKSALSVQKLPDFYIRRDPGFWTNMTKRITVAGVKPFKLHLYCNYGDGSENKHEVEGQPGRTISLAWDSSQVFSVLAPAIKTLWSKFGPGVKIDTFVDAIFDGGDIRTVDRKRLQGLQKTSETPMETLKEYIDCTGGLKQIIKDFDENFRKDFRLQQMNYRSGRIGWYCDEHFDTAFKEEEWKD